MPKTTTDLPGSGPAATALTRRQWTSLLGVVAGSASLAAQQPAPASRDLLAEQREAANEAIAEMKKVKLDPADEPIFGLVVR